MSASATVRHPSAIPVSAQPSTLRLLAEMIGIALLLAGWGTFTGTSVLLDATPIPGDGTFFGQLAGIVIPILVWRLNKLRGLIFG